MARSHATKKPDGEWLVSTEVAAHMCNVTPVTINRWLREDNPPPKEASGWPVRALGDWIREHQPLKKVAGGQYPYMSSKLMQVPQRPSGTGGMPSAIPQQKTLQSEKMRYETARADKLEMENKVAAGELIPVIDVENAWASILSRVKTRILNVPVTAARICVGDDEMASIQRKLTDQLKDALSELSANWRDEDTDDD